MVVGHTLGQYRTSHIRSRCMWFCASIGYGRAMRYLKYGMSVPDIHNTSKSMGKVSTGHYIRAVSVPGIAH
eukprot:1615386-Rhodomonas_salina.1